MRLLGEFIDDHFSLVRYFNRVSFKSSSLGENFEWIAVRVLAHHPINLFGHLFWALLIFPAIFVHVCSNLGVRILGLIVLEPVSLMNCLVISTVIN